MIVGAGAEGAYSQKERRKRKTMIDEINKYRKLPRKAGRDDVPPSTSVLTKQTPAGRWKEVRRDGRRQ
ncbi:hypothetical protein TNCV_1772221 [Trichonephila clavipes]|nr:hypothetical protein TNCV_1772221 [Trichonephila clavipes]